MVTSCPHESACADRQPRPISSATGWPGRA